MTLHFSPLVLPTWLAPTHLQGMLRGVEKEGLRMQPDGYLAQSAHPKALGSTLTHPHITTDYSESLLELITSPQPSIAAMLTMLTQLHALVFANLENDELLWPLSMPCMLSAKEEDIPLAQYGSSNIGQLKTLYRHGLGLRYGRRMQTIAGLHYNLSFPDALFEQIQQAHYPEKSLQAVKNTLYLGLIRNFKRLSAMVLYLLGASPSVCPCFLIGRKHHLQPLAKHSLYLPHATSLRMGKFGYQNSAQDDIDIHYNQLPEYVAGLRAAISQPHADFTALGVDDADGKPTQINDHILQIENEYYSPIRPKQVAKRGETPTHALEDRGIAYIELRAVDLDPYSSVGISEEAAHFLETLALYCMLQESPPLYAAEEALLAENQAKVVNAGRDVATQIVVNDKPVNFHAWLQNQLADMQAVAAMLDQAGDTTAHSHALKTMQARANDPSLTPSAKVLADTIAQHGVWNMGSSLAKQYATQYQAADFMSQVLPAEKKAHYEKLVSDSLAEQAQLEASDTMPFTQFVQAYR